jgi:uncharacterized NAD(P)/FAD-binding protein YdhS
LIEDTQDETVIMLEHHTGKDYGMGYVQYIPEHFFRALCFSKSIKEEPVPVSAADYFKRGMAYHYGKKDCDKAVADLEMAVKLDPDEDDYREYLERTKAAKERGK